MVVECPQCQAKYQLDEKQFAGRTEITVRCTRCGARFPEKVPEALIEPEPEAGPPQPFTEEAFAAPATPSAPSSPELPGEHNVSLAVTEGPLKGNVYPIAQSRVVVGRAGADIIVADTEVSRQHCALEIYGRTAKLQDLGSTNGTWANGERIESVELEHLSEFRIGSTVLIFTVTNKA
ncbi:MAG: FHA domain-containing protein [Candidatus Acidiferrales bacterium]